MPALPFRPRFEYGTGPTTLDLSLPLRYPVPVSVAVGGTAFSAARTPASYEVRRDRLTDIMIRFREAEWPAVRAMVEFGQAHPNTLDFYPDQLLPLVFTVFLVQPSIEQEFSPQRLPDYPEAYELALRLLTVDGSAIDFEWFS